MTTKKQATPKVKDVEAAMAAKAEGMSVATRGKTSAKVPAKRTPTVIEGVAVTEHVDPDAERALKDPAVAADFNAAKTLFRDLLDLEGQRLEKLKAIAETMMDLRAHFKQPGSKGRRIDWNGDSTEYKALAALLYRDLGLEGQDHDSTKRSIRYQVENVKRERVPAKQWEHYGIQALTRGQRQALTAKFGKNLGEVETAAEETGKQAAQGTVTGAQLVALAKRIDAGISVYSMASLRTLTPNQRKTFREQLADTRAKTDALLKELDGLDG
ncbi:hypothetical protein AB0O20_11885 [Streptomyces kronopolitis]|uniref:hypothetical protein n=1 Tax=Streptomyces kronopolitis TaxID=1612435 RepID=UPI003428F4A7